MTRYHKIAEVKKIRVHDLRHSHASLLINNDVNHMIILKRLGHAKVDITLDTYSHLYPSKEEKVIKKNNHFATK
nr:tyrosine-type recombinase/integrase [Ilyobacter polytropus]